MYKPSPEAAANLEEIMSSGPASGWSMPQLVGFFKSVAGLWLDNSSLAPLPARLDDPFLRAGIELVVNGSGHDEIRSVMAVRKHTILAEDERRYDIGTTALVAIGWAEHPRVLEERCRALLEPGAAPGTPVSGEGKNRIEELEALLAAKPASVWTPLELIEFMKTALGVARAGGLLALDDIPERLDDPFLKAPFRLLVDGCDVEIVRSVLLDRKRTLLADRERRCDMMITGLCGLATGNSPRVIEAECSAFLPEGG
jgi:flagellar motor component MotA